MDWFRAPSATVLLASGLIAGTMGFMFSRRSQQRSMGGPRMLAMRAKDLGEVEMAKVGREFFSEKVVPEIKPVMIDLLKEAESYLNHYFRRAEKAIKAM